MRRNLALILALSCVSRLAIAQPAPSEPPPITSDLPADPVAAPSPWMPGNGTPTDPPPAAPAPTGGAIDLAPEGVLSPIAEAHRHAHPRAAIIGISALYAGFVGWMYYAWYRKHKALSEYKFGGDGWLGSRTYAGGADKFGHAWATMSLARLGTEILNQGGGIDRTKSIIISAAMSELLFIGVEVKDGFFYEFSFSDLSGDTVGFLLALALQLSPRLDELFDYRVQYYPSAQYKNQVTGTTGAPLGGKLNIAEDYSGQTYLVAFHLGGIHALRDLKYGFLSRFVDIAFGFGTRGYKPEPSTGPLPEDQHHQNLYLGVSLTAQGLFDWLLGDISHHPDLRKVTHAGFEVFNLPFTFGPILEHSHSPSGSISQDGA